MNATTPTALPFTGDAEADALLATDPMALLIGFVLDQQVSVQKAFAGPLELRRRVGTLDAAELAAMDAGDLEAAFRARPALHRFPGNMAKRTQALCAAVAETYGDDPSTIWNEASDGHDLERRLLALPGIGEMKVKALLAILHKRFGLELDGLDAVLPGYPTLGDVDSADALASYQEQKRAYKARLKAEGGSFDPKSSAKPA
ncbi:MAG: HhH-GPD-type base excision DNA repair protein [Candidatus Limnocylindrales bacterium]